MTAEKVFLAVDMGASSGRVLAGLFDGRRLRIEEVYRFDNGPVLVAEHMYWDVLAQWSNVLAGLRAAAASYGNRITSVGVDTWGVDFALLGRGDELLGNPVHYRDRRTAGILEKAFAVVSRNEIFEETGLQFIEFNSLFQLLAMRLSDSPILEAAQSLLMMPDLFHWLMTGIKVNEFTNATTTQFYDPRKRTWCTSLLERLGLPSHILGTITPPGNRLGPLRASVAEDTGLGHVEVVLPGTHDTASAVMSVPAGATDRPWCYISSGTWSLMGVETAQPVVNDKCRDLNFTNEGGVGGTIRLLKNIAGLWPLQECRRIWQQTGRDYDWQELVDIARAAPALAAQIDPDHSGFVAPRNMPQAIRAFCQDTGQPPPQSDGAIIRCALESLALRYRMVLEWLEELTRHTVETIHIVGGGTRNELLCQMAADACQRRIVAGPVEATAIGNVMMQAVAQGDVGSIAQARDVIRASFDVQEYVPRDAAPWEDAYARFQTIVAAGAD